MKTVIDSNKKSWFTIDRKIKQYQNNTPIKKVKTKDKGLFKRPSRMNANELDTTSKYVLAIRESFKQNKEVETDDNTT